MFVLLLAVPALLIVVLGYAVGHALWAAVTGGAGGEVAGWITGLVALACVVRLAVVLVRRRRRD